MTNEKFKFKTCKWCNNIIYSEATYCCQDCKDEAIDYFQLTGKQINPKKTSFKKLLYAKEYVLKNKQKIRVRQKLWYLKNRERIIIKKRIKDEI